MARRSGSVKALAAAYNSIPIMVPRVHKYQMRPFDEASEKKEAHTQLRYSKCK